MCEIIFCELIKRLTCTIRILRDNIIRQIMTFNNIDKILGLLKQGTDTMILG